MSITAEQREEWRTRAIRWTQAFGHVALQNAGDAVLALDNALTEAERRAEAAERSVNTMKLAVKQQNENHVTLMSMLEDETAKRKAAEAALTKEATRG